MSENSEASTQPAKDAEIAEKSEASSNKRVSKSFQDLIDVFFMKAEEFKRHRRAIWDTYIEYQITSDAIEEHWNNTNLNLNMIDLDSLSTLDDYVHLFALETDLVKYEADLLASERAGLKKLDDLLALGAEIMTDHAFELETVDVEIRDRLIKRSESLSRYRIKVMNSYKKIVYKGP
ncbi:hypothetical protein KCU98_g4466, partial [Aureobasidium melanogenum]